MHLKQSEKGLQSTNPLLMADSLGSNDRPFEIFKQEIAEDDEGFQNIFKEMKVDEKLI